MSPDLDLTTAQQRRLTLAAALVDGCPDVFAGDYPPILVNEIALTGSTARGAADDDSDLEMNLFSEGYLPSADLIFWLNGTGAVDLMAEPSARDDGSCWVAGMLNGVPIEIGNQTFADLAATITRLVTDPDLPPRWIALGDLLLTAKPLRTQGRFDQIIAPLRTYPDALRARLLAESGGKLAKRDRAAALRLAARGEWIALAEQTAADCAAALTYLYAVDRRWQPGRKWTLTAAADLPSAPPDLAARIGALLAARTPVAVSAGYDLLKEIACIAI